MGQDKSRSRAGQFQAGESGNPAGRRPRKVFNLDGWMNDLTGLGILGRDKTLGSASNVMFAPDIVSGEDAMQLWRGDDIAARVVETIPNEALRQGWEISVGAKVTPDRFTPSQPDQEGALSGGPPRGRRTMDRRARRDAGADNLAGADLQEAVTKRISDLGLLGAIREVMCYERAYGGSAILLGANDFATDLRTPLDLSRVRSLDWITPLEPRELQPRWYYNNPRAAKFGQPAIYQLTPYAAGASIDASYSPATTEIHESRLVLFPGIRVTKRTTGTATLGWGDSVFTRIVRALRDFNASHASATALLADFSQGIYKVKNLAELVSLDGPQALLAKMASIELMRSILRAVIVDADGEDFERKSTSLGGLPETLDRLSLRLAAACDMPLTKLMGSSAQGLNATGEGDDNNWDDKIQAVRTLTVAPAVMRVVEILLRTMGEDPATLTYSVKFPPLHQPTQQEIANARLAQAQADAIYLAADVVSPEEMALSRFGGETYSSETHVDFEARAEMEAVAAPPVDAAPEPPPPAPPPPFGADPGESKAEPEPEPEP